MLLPALASRLLRIGLAFPAKGGCLTFAFAFNLFEPLGELLGLLNQRIDDRLLQIQQRLTAGALGRDSRRVHVAQGCD